MSNFIFFINHQFFIRKYITFLFPHKNASKQTFFNAHFEAFLFIQAITYSLLIILIMTNCSGSLPYNAHFGSSLPPNGILLHAMYILAGNTANKNAMIAFFKHVEGLRASNNKPKTTSNTPVINTAAFLNGRYVGMIALNFCSSLKCKIPAMLKTIPKMTLVILFTFQHPFLLSSFCQTLVISHQSYPQSSLLEN